MLDEAHIDTTDDDQANARRKGLRVALAVAVGLTWSVHSGMLIPFLGPLFAAQFLISSSKPLALGKAVGLVIVIVGAGVLLQLITAAAGHRPLVFLLLLGLIYFLCFFVQAQGKVAGPPIFFVLVISVMVPLMALLNSDLASFIFSTLVEGVMTGVVLMWLAHLLIPHKGPSRPEHITQSQFPGAMRFALCNAIILLFSVLACLTLENLSSAIVIPITVASLLSQADVARSPRATLGLLAVNLLGGVTASISFAVYLIRPSGISLFLIVLLIGLTFGGRAAQERPDAKLFAGALTIFLIVFGLGVSPIPGSAGETFANRLFFIVAAVAYTIFMAILLGPRMNANGLTVPGREPS